MEKKELAVVLVFVALALGALLFSIDRHNDVPEVTVRTDTTDKDENAESKNHKYVIYLITMNQGSNYWQQINIGCEKAAQELGSDVLYKWTAPLNPTDEEQAECVDKAVADGANAIVISARSPEGINQSLKRAAEAGVKIVYVDNAATFTGVATLLTDNEVAGRLAGQTMLKALKEANITSGVIGLGANTVARNGVLRDKGFREAFVGTPFTVAPTVPMDGKRENIKEMVIEHPEYIAFFGANEQITGVISKQVKESGSKQIIVGFDTSDYTLSMIHEGVIYATMQQNPKKMGHDGLIIAFKSLKGEYKEPPGKIIDTGVEVITRDEI